MLVHRHVGVPQVAVHLRTPHPQPLPFPVEDGNGAPGGKSRQGGLELFSGTARRETLEVVFAFISAPFQCGQLLRHHVADRERGLEDRVSVQGAGILSRYFNVLKLILRQARFSGVTDVV
ncbi:MAG TPA: hypothetical protein DCZ75_04500 [Geobacter sp.]|nr:hypothetical protein [Geobacter sp.]